MLIAGAAGTYFGVIKPEQERVAAAKVQAEQLAEARAAEAARLAEEQAAKLREANEATAKARADAAEAAAAVAAKAAATPHTAAAAAPSESDERGARPRASKPHSGGATTKPAGSGKTGGSGACDPNDPLCGL